MLRIELQDLAAPSTASQKSRADLLGELTAAAMGEAPPAPIAAVTPESVSSRAGDTAATLGSSTAAADVYAMVQQPVKDVTEQMSELARQITSLGTTQQTQIGVTQDNTQAVTQNTSAKSQGGSAAATVGGIASGFLGSLALSPIISGLLGLFGGGSSSKTVAAPVRFELPAAIRAEAGLTSSPGSSVVPVDYGERGQVRVQQGAPATQVNIQVNAMDSQSFLDHSEEIAQAVKQAILNSHSINDVLADL